MFEVKGVIPVTRAKTSPGSGPWGPGVNSGAPSNPRLVKDRVWHLEGFHREATPAASAACMHFTEELMIGIRDIENGLICVTKLTQRKPDMPQKHTFVTLCSRQ